MILVNSNIPRKLLSLTERRSNCTKDYFAKRLVKFSLRSFIMDLNRMKKLD